MLSAGKAGQVRQDDPLAGVPAGGVLVGRGGCDLRADLRPGPGADLAARRVFDQEVEVLVGPGVLLVAVVGPGQGHGHDVLVHPVGEPDRGARRCRCRCGAGGKPVAHEADRAIEDVAAVVARGVDPHDPPADRLVDDPVDRPPAVAVAAAVERPAEQDDIHLAVHREPDRAAEHGRPVGVEEIELRPRRSRPRQRPDDLRHVAPVAVAGLERLAVLGVAQVVPADELGVVVLDDLGGGGEVAAIARVTPSNP